MKIGLVLFFLLVSFPASAKTYYTPSGVSIETEMPSWTLQKKVWILPSGIAYLAENLVPIARAGELTLREEIELWLKSYAEQYGINLESFRTLAWCESGLEPTAFNPKDPNGGSYGLFQWQKHSWAYYNKKFKTDLDRNSWKNQVEISARVLAEKNGWRNWINCTKDRKIKW